MTKGTKLTISKVVFGKVQKVKYFNNQAKEVYAYVTDEYGNKGWIYVPERDAKKILIYLRLIRDG